jgi:hypothetical protein
MRGRLDARRTLKSLVADLRFINPLLELLVVLNFGISVRLLKKHVPLNDLED